MQWNSFVINVFLFMENKQSLISQQIRKLGIGQPKAARCKIYISTEGATFNQLDFNSLKNV